MLVNTQLRRVPGGFIARTYLGDRWGWRLFDAKGQPLPFTARTAKEAMVRLALPSLLSEEQKSNDQ